MTTAENENDPFDWDHAEDDDFADLERESDPTDTKALQMLRQAVAEDPFATSHLDDCLPGAGLGPSALARFERASAAFLESCRTYEQNNEAQEILRKITLYWLRKSRPVWLDWPD
ncbi:MAG: hypothetical protein EOS55_18290 [Mesorhizobium sp.]|nr:MAG: hypothetical protein EOS55_18290 [Mesorhizobium sp.]